MNDKTDSLARRKEELRLLARIERIELAAHVHEIRRLRKPANFALVGAKILGVWRNPAWISTAAALLAARGVGSSRLMRALRYAGYAYAAWRTYRLFKEYAGQPANPAASRP